MLVRDNMTPYPKTLYANNTLKEAAKLFAKYKINGAPVVDEHGEIRGLLTSSHFVKIIAGDESFDQTVEAVMLRHVITIAPDSTLEDAYHIPVSCLPVISADNKIVGILTKRDCLKAFRSSADHATNEIEAFIRSAHNGIVVINAYGIITTYNDAAARLIGTPPEKAIGRPIEDILPDSRLKSVLTTGLSERGCHLMVNGQLVFSNRSPIFAEARIVGALAIIQDTSELADVARQLSRTQHHVEALENIFESARQGFVVVDENGIITQVNKSYEEIFNINREDLIGHPAEESIEGTKLHIVAQTGIPELGVIQNYKGRQVIVNRLPIFKDGKAIGAIGEIMFKDITEVNYLLERLNTLEKQVTQYKTELGQVRQEPSRAEFTFADIVGSSRAIVQAKNLAVKAARNDSNVLILGESGTGKELFSHAIHNASQRSKMPFIAVNCAAIPSELLESELFGYEEGSFTGAKKGGKKGKFELADRGTLFLDEIGDMPLSMQAKILRAIQDKSFDPVGGNKTCISDVRIIAATNKNLALMVSQQTFREDLYYRLNVLLIKVPALRERKEDIGELLLRLLPNICNDLGVQPKEFAPEAMGLLRQHSWPGNIRELENILEQLAATIDNRLITPQHLMHTNFAANFGETGRTVDQNILPPGLNERDKIVETLKYAGNNKVMTAKLLGWHRSTLYEKMKRYNLK